MCRAAAAISNKDSEILTETIVYLSKRPHYSHKREKTGRHTAVMGLSALERDSVAFCGTLLRQLRNGQLH